jgi:2-polyprenyl-6-methoxyphenol hydroxylase-like FAD-dependent oxidoreductase
MGNGNETSLPVLVVGAGPVGLTMALALTLQGVRCRIIDKAEQPSDKSKALALQSRTVELFDLIGIVETFLAAGRKVHATNFYHGDKKLLHLAFDELEGAYPFALMIPQNETERQLTEHLQKHSINVERGLELVNFQQDPDSVTAVLRHADGREETVVANWLVGCDGAHSTTRHTLGLKFEGAAYNESFATADVHVSWSNPEDEIFAFVHDEGTLVFFPLGEHRYRIIADGPLHATGDPLTLEEMQETVSKRGPSNLTLSDPVWLTWFTISRRSASDYRVGRVFLAGDSAHIHSPALGQGMNTGMQDAINLAWKLALTEKGLASPELLDTYQEERHPIGQNLLKLTDAVTKLMMLRNPIAQQLRNRLMPMLASHEVVQRRAWRTISMLGINYRNSPIVGEHRENFVQAVSDMPSWLDFAHGPAPGDRAPDGVLKAGADAESIRLFDFLRGIDHNILFFAGLKDGEKSFSTIAKTISEVQSKYGEYVRCHVILPQSYTSTELKSIDSVLLDEDHSLHCRYGAAHQCLYLIRPDGYVGFRGQPIDFSPLDKIMGKVRRHLTPVSQVSRI